MRQETTNTFDKGLNKDLNPIVTPNEVLTDCLNGTFITFNGDELVLQNDAGNTKIPIKWDERLSTEYVEGGSYNSGVIVKTTNDSDETVLFKSMKDHNIDFIWREDGSINTDSWELFDPSVKLSDGFYPIGIREYGGVLYIVSGKKGNIGEVRVKGNIGEARLNGSIIREGDQDAVRDILYVSGGIGAEEDLVEFGSYPSPKNVGSQEFYGYNVTNINSKNDLYKTKTINDHEFKTGGYVTFANSNQEGTPSLDPNLLWTPDNKGFYKIRLLHQLDNGVQELTKDIWEKYSEYRDSVSLSPEHWINSDDFRYFCPNRYKGTLATVIEINEPEYFRFKTLPRVAIADEGMINLFFNVEWENGGAVNISGWTANILLQEIEGKIFEREDNLNPIPLDPTSEYLSYEIVPKTDYEWDAFPEEFKSKYTIRGNILLEYFLKGYNFTLYGGECLGDTGKKKFNIAVLSMDKKLLDKDFTIISENSTTKPIAFMRKGYTGNVEEYQIIGEYTIAEENMVLDTESAQYIEFLAETSEDDKNLLEHFNELSKTQKLVIEDSTCLNRQVTFTFGYDPTFVNFRWVGDSHWTNFTREVATPFNEYSISYRSNTDLIITVDGTLHTIKASEIEPGKTIDIEAAKEKLVCVSPTGSLTYINTETVQADGVSPNFSLKFKYPTHGYTGESATLKLSYTLKSSRTGPLTPYDPSDHQIVLSSDSWKVRYTESDVVEGTVNITFRLDLIKSPTFPGGGSQIPNEGLGEDETQQTPPFYGVVSIDQSAQGGLKEKLSFSILPTLEDI